MASALVMYIGLCKSRRYSTDHNLKAQSVHIMQEIM
jgi:hypothetical protein